MSIPDQAWSHSEDAWGDAEVELTGPSTAERAAHERARAGKRGKA